LSEEQTKVLKIISAPVKEYRGFERENEWRPLYSKESITPSKPNKTGMDYFNLIGDEPFKYYWKR